MSFLFKRIVKIGNGHFVLLDKTLMKLIGAKRGDQLEITIDEVGVFKGSDVYPCKEIRMRLRTKPR